MCGAFCFSGSGFSTIVASVVNRSAATDAAFSSATRATLCRINDACFEEVFVLLAVCVEPECAGTFLDLVGHYRSIQARIGNDLADGFFDRTADDSDTHVLIGVFTLEVLQRRQATQVRDTTTGHDAFFDSSTRCMECIFDARFLFLHLDFRCCTDLEHRNAHR